MFLKWIAMFNKAVDGKLLPIGARVVHYDRNIGRMVRGTILGYNKLESCAHFRNKRKELMFLSFGEVRRCDKQDGGMCVNIPDCPYIVRFDPTADNTGCIKFPEGYRDVYSASNIRPVEPAENIFPNSNIAIMARQWPEEACDRTRIKQWSPWHPMTQEEYEQNKNNTSFEFCVRQVELKDMVPMIPLWRSHSSNDYDPAGYWPSLYSRVNFHLRDGSFHTGITAIVKIERPDKFERVIEPVFLVEGDGSMRIYTLEQVQEWCFVNNVKE